MHVLRSLNVDNDEYEFDKGKSFYAGIMLDINEKIFFNKFSISTNTISFNI